MLELPGGNIATLPGVELRNAAAWTQETEVTFYAEGSLAGSTEIDFMEQGRALIVHAERLRDELASAPVEFLKIDVEGAENDVLFDLRDQLARIDLVFFEDHSTKGKPQKLGTLLEMMTAKGFRYDQRLPHRGQTARRDHAAQIRPAAQRVVLALTRP